MLYNMVGKGFSDEGTSEQRPEAETREKATGPPGQSNAGKGNRMYGGPEAEMLGLPISLPPSTPQNHSRECNSLPNLICIIPKIWLDKGLKERAGNEELEEQVEKQGTKAITHETGLGTMGWSRSRLGTAGLVVLGNLTLHSASYLWVWRTIWDLFGGSSTEWRGVHVP